MRFCALALLVAFACDAAPRIPSRTCDVASRRSDRGGVYCSSYTDGGVSFLFALSPSASEECTCADSTSATILGGNSVSVSVARSTNGYCTKGVTPTTDAGSGRYFGGISADAGMVNCAANKLRIMQGASADGGYGLLAEAAAQQLVPASQDLDSVADWSLFGQNGPAAPTRTANAAVAPDGTTTAERLQFEASTSTGRSIIFPATNTCPAGACSCSVYAKGHSSANQVLGMVIVDGSTFTTYRCPVASATTWTRCLLENVTLSGVGPLHLGSLSFYDGVDSAAADVDLWGVQCEAGTQATSYFPSATTTTPTRAKDKNTASLLVVPTGSNLTVSAEAAYFSSVVASAALVDLEGTITGGAGTNYFDLGVSSGKLVECNNLVDNVTDTVTGSAYTANAINAVSCVFDGDTALSACKGATCSAGTATSPPTRSLALGVGAKWDGLDWAQQPNAVVKNIQISTSATKLLDLFGDSICAGANLSTADARPQGIIHTYNGNTVATQNFCIGGDTIEGSHEEFASALANIVALGFQQRSTMVVASGTNSLTGPDPNDGGAYDVNIVWHLMAMLREARDAGVSSYVTTLVPRPAEAASITAVNTRLANVAADAGFSAYVIDTYTPLVVTDGGVAFRTGCSLADEVHPNDGGEYVWTRTICASTGICTVPTPTGTCQ